MFKDGVIVFRGTCKTLKEIEKFKKNVGHKIPWKDDVYWIRPSKLQTLFGMTSTSKSFDTAWKFAYYDPGKALQKVIFKIDLKSRRNFCVMDMSEHPYEEEVLLSEGMSFVVKSVDLKEHLTEVEGQPSKKENYYLINLQCFDKKADKTVYWLTFFSMLVGNPISVFVKAFRARKHGTFYRKFMCYLILIINAFIMLPILALFYFTILDLLLAYQNS